MIQINEFNMIWAADFGNMLHHICGLQSSTFSLVYIAQGEQRLELLLELSTSLLSLNWHFQRHMKRVVNQ